MIDWFKKEYRRFKESRTVRLAYYTKALGVVMTLSSLLPVLKDYITPETMGVAVIILGYLAKQLRLATTTGIE